jgi:hypothetical protein
LTTSCSRGLPEPCQKSRVGTGEKELLGGPAAMGTGVAATCGVVVWSTWR